MGRFRAAVFLDRDGTVIEERHYLADPGQVRLIPGAGEAIARLNRAGFAVVLVTNQSGVARGYFDEARVRAVHERLEALLAEQGARLDALYYCPHLETGAVEAYRVACRCRKPLPGMVEAAREALELEGLPAWVVGDRGDDIALARAVGAKGVLVRTGYGAGLEASICAGPCPPDFVVDDLPRAIDRILEAGMDADDER